MLTFLYTVEYINIFINIMKFYEDKSELCTPIG